MTTKQKIAAACAAGGILSVLGLCCCGGFWGVSEYRAKQEKERIEAQQKKAAEEAKAKIAEAFKGVFKNMEPIPEKKIAYLKASEATNLDGVKFELLRGSVGKVKYKYRKIGGGFLDMQTDKPYFQVHFRVSNGTANKIISYRAWGRDAGLNDKVVDEFDNRYSFWPPSTDDPETFRSRIEPGMTFEHLFGFDVPLEQSKEIRVTLSGSNIGQKGTIAYKLPRSFFDGK